MPNYCGQCGGCYDYEDDKYFCAISENSFDVYIDTFDAKKIKRHRKCPLKSVEGLIEKVEQLKKSCANDSYGKCMTNAISCVEKLIKEYCDQ